MIRKNQSTTWKKNFSSKLKNGYPDDKEIERTKEGIKIFSIKNGEKLNKLYLRSDVIFSAEICEKFIKVSIKEFDVNPLSSVCFLGYTWQCELK